ncbi:MAG: efflux pump, family, rane fusion protein [Bacteroidetes bacterium]|nr:efflux pump, family, rane fusion protein [Bacteroidota bacterium]
MTIALISVAAIAAAYFLFFRGEKTTYEFRLDKISRGNITMNVTATGTINAVTTVAVGTQVSGIIAKLYADFNSIVKEGQVIAQIDPTFLQQSVKDASASLERAQAQYNDAQRSYERTKSLFEKNLESQATYDAALTALESNRAVLKQAEASLDRAKINLAYATIYAPINGVVIDRQVNVGQTVAASFSSPTLYTIANDLHKMQVQATIDESDIGQISVGQEATFTVDAYPDDIFRGTVSQIRLAPVTIQNVVNYTVVVDVDNKQLKLMPGMTANVKILVGSREDALRVPNMALRFQPPSDLIDSTKFKEQRMSGMGREGGSPMGERMRTEGGGPSAQGAGTEERRTKMRALRDSIQAAHAGKLSEEDLRTEVRKAFERMRKDAEPPVVSVVKPGARAGANTRFGIQITFPEYQKSDAAGVGERQRGRVWILNAQKKLEPVFVITGLSDGRYTEIITEGLKDGDQVVLGATSSASNGSGQTASPLTGGQRRPATGGGPPR